MPLVFCIAPRDIIVALMALQEGKTYQHHHRHHRRRHHHHHHNHHQHHRAIQSVSLQKNRIVISTSRSSSSSSVVVIIMSKMMNTKAPVLRLFQCDAADVFFRFIVCCIDDHYHYAYDYYDHISSHLAFASHVIVSQ